MPGYTTTTFTLGYHSVLQPLTAQSRQLQQCTCVYMYAHIYIQCMQQKNLERKNAVGTWNLWNYAEKIVAVAGLRLRISSHSTVENHCGSGWSPFFSSHSFQRNGLHYFSDIPYAFITAHMHCSMVMGMEMLAQLAACSHGYK